MSPSSSSKSSKGSKKQLEYVVKLQIPAGKANPAPPIGTALGPKGVNMMEFCKAFNDKTASLGSDIIPVVIQIYKDKSFTFETKKPPMSVLIRNELSLKSGSKTPGREVVAKISMESVRKIAEIKVSDLNSYDMEAALSMVIGTARSMGIEVDNG